MHWRRLFRHDVACPFCLAFDSAGNVYVGSDQALGLGPVTPDGPMAKEKYRLVVEGPPNWTHFREFWRMFHAEGAVRREPERMPRMMAGAPC